MYLAKGETNWLGCLGKAFIGIALAPLLLAAAAAMAVLRISFSVFGSSSSSGGFLTDISREVLGYFFTRKLMGPSADVPVRDLRLLDANGTEHLVRIRGELRAGSVAVGDDVTAECVDRAGTLLLRRGYNHRTRAKILVAIR